MVRWSGDNSAVPPTLAAPTLQYLYSPSRSISLYLSLSLSLSLSEVEGGERMAIEELPLQRGWLWRSSLYSYSCL